MEPRRSKTQVSFARLLRAYQTGGIGSVELISQVDEHLTAGALRSELLDTLRRRESVEPLPDEIYLAIWSRLRRVAQPLAETAVAARHLGSGSGETVTP